MNKAFSYVRQLYEKCDTKDVLCGDHDDTCATVLKTLEMSAIVTYKVGTTHLHKDDLLEPIEQAYAQDTIASMLKHKLFPSCKGEHKTLRKQMK